MINFDKALQDPGLAFKRPTEILQSKELSREQKIKLLRQWEYDVREIQVAVRRQYGRARTGNLVVYP